ncbi:MAG: beta-glucanase precursor [Gammaproteobacteria bacterium]
MKRILSLALLALALNACSPARVTTEQVSEVAKTLDYGDYRSYTLAGKGWDALAADDHAAVIAYTSKCVELYGERGKNMNAGLTLFPPVEKVNDYWALNDVGTCLFIMGSSYEKLRMYPEAAAAFRSLEEDFSFSQCWDPKGWYWQPAMVVAGKASKYATK